jgi:nucleotide-binding universal stress UspA family protein
MSHDPSPPTSSTPPVLLIAIDATDTAETILRCGAAIAARLDMPPHAIHVTDGSRPVTQAQQAADRAGVPLRVMTGDPHTTLLQEAAHPEVSGIVLGIRERADDPRLTGSLARRVLEETNQPVIAVPPNTTIGTDHDLLRALLPLDGTQITADRARPLARALHDHGVEVIAAHVFDLDTVPMFFDQLQHGLDSWAHEFLARQGALDDPLLLRSGTPDHQVLDLAEQEDVDLVVLVWSRDLSPGHAQVIRRLLQNTTVPLLVLPLAPTLAATARG